MAFSESPSHPTRDRDGATSPDSSIDAAVYRLGSAAAVIAFAANLLDIVLGFGTSELALYGTRNATDWFALYRQNWFQGLYVLGLMNLIYMTAMVPVYLAILVAHRRNQAALALLALVIASIGTAIYISNGAALPMFVLAGKYAAAATDSQRVLYAAAGEAVLARGEDFTLGAFPGLFTGGLAALAVSVVLLRGGIFGRLTAWIGVWGFTFLIFYTVWTTIVPGFNAVAFYGFGMIGGLLTMSWFLLVARTLWHLGRSTSAASTGP